ncbi:uncharacterized protein DMENIID0001_117160 [Sergentomyia squamirostris]
MLTKIVRPLFRDIFTQKCLNFYSSAIKCQHRKEFSEKIHQFSHVKANFTGVSNVKILPYDLLECPDANLLKATVIQGNDAHINIQVQEKEVTIEQTGKAEEILLEIPVKADVTVEADGSLQIRDLHSDKLSANASRGITTKNLRSECIHLQSEGDIACQGLTLGYSVILTAKGESNVSLEKIQGEDLFVESENGSISTESCYSSNSKFTTKSGDLNLNSVHKTTEVNIEEVGNLNMIGFNGTLLAKVHKGNVRLQLAELWGENVLITNQSDQVLVNVSDSVVDSTYVHAASPDVHVDESLQHLRGEKETGATTLGEKNLPNRLFIQTKGRLDIRRLSWIDAIKLKM